MKHVMELSKLPAKAAEPDNDQETWVDELFEFWQNPLAGFVFPISLKRTPFIQI